ncbi:MAG: cache domain-containing protein [Giesbergeria sp.]
MRAHALRYAESTGANLAYALQQSIGTLLRNLDTSLQGLAKDLENPQVMALSPDLRNRVLFDYSLRAAGLSAVLVLDAQGRLLLDSAGSSAEEVDFSDRDYFRAFQSGGHQGLFIGKPIRTRTTDRDCLPVSRAWFKKDGSFGGVVVGAIRAGLFPCAVCCCPTGAEKQSESLPNHRRPGRRACRSAMTMRGAILRAPATWPASPPAPVARSPAGP